MNVSELPPLRVLCPYCNAPWTIKMECELAAIAGACDTCDFYDEITGTIDIYCDNCKKLVYRKEVSE